MFKFELCVQHQIHLEPEWVPREENQLADYLSRIVDYDDWYLNPHIFTMLDRLWGPHTVDRFANHRNTHLPLIVRQRIPLQCTGVGKTTGGAHHRPLFPQFPKVLKHAEICKAKGTLVVPVWAGPFWPLICPNGQDFAKFVDAFVSLPLSDNLYNHLNTVAPDVTRVLHIMYVDTR